jgi:hypothetical protein
MKSRFLNSTLPNEGSDIHPWMPTQLHNGRSTAVHVNREHCRVSPLGRRCEELGVSIHDREKVWNADRKLQQEMLGL